MPVDLVGVIFHLDPLCRAAFPLYPKTEKRKEAPTQVGPFRTATTFWEENYLESMWNIFSSSTTVLLIFLRRVIIGTSRVTALSEVVLTHTVAYMHCIYVPGSR